MQSTSNIPLFIVGGINNPAAHSTMVGLFSADGSSMQTKSFFTPSSTVTISYSSAPTVTTNGSMLSWMDTLTPEISGEQFGTYMNSHEGGGVYSTVPIASRHNVRAEANDTTSLWFDPGLRGGGESKYYVNPLKSNQLEYRYPNHAGITDGPEMSKSGNALLDGAWKYGLPRHSNQFFIHGSLYAAKRNSLSIEPPYANVNTYNTRGSFFCSRYGTPASCFRFGINNYFSTRALEPLYNTVRKVRGGVEPWSINFGGAQDFHCTMWIRPVSSNWSETIKTNASVYATYSYTERAHTTPLFSIGRGGGAGMSFTIEDDNMPTWDNLKLLTGLKIDSTPLSSFNAPVNIWLTQRGVSALTHQWANTGYSTDNRLKNITFSQQSLGWTTRAANGGILASTTFADNSLTQIRTGDKNGETDSFRYINSVLSPHRAWLYIRDVYAATFSNVSTVATTAKQHLSELEKYLTLTSTGSDDMLFWGLSSGGSHLTLRFQDRVIHEAPETISSDQWHNVGFFIRPLTGTYTDKRNTQSGIFVNGSLIGLKDYYTDTSTKQYYHFPGENTVSQGNTTMNQQNASTGDGEVSIGRAILSKDFSRHVATLSRDANFGTDQYFYTYPSWAMIYDDHDGNDNIFYIEHPDGYGEHFGSRKEITYQGQENKFSLNVSAQHSGPTQGFSYPKGSKIWYVRSSNYVNSRTGVHIAPINTRLGEVYYGHNNTIKSVFDLENLNDWSYFFKSFYSFTHCDTVRGSWQHDSNLQGDTDASVGTYYNMPALTATLTTDVSAGWGMLRYGGFDHKQYGTSWENTYLDSNGSVPSPEALGF